MKFFVDTADLDEIADSESESLLLLSDSITFGTDALLSFDTEGFTRWEMVNGVHVMDFTTAEVRDETFVDFSEMLDEAVGRKELFSFYVDGNGIALGVNLNAVPEPSTWLLGLLGFGLLGSLKFFSTKKSSKLNH